MPIGPRAGGYMGYRSDERGDEQQVNRNPFTRGENERLDPLVRWAQEADSALMQAKRTYQQRMRRNRELYDGNHWSSPRAPWKNSSVINYCAWVADQWAAVLADNKPKATFETYQLALQQEAELLTAAWDDIYERGNWQAVIEDSILMSRIEMVSYLNLTYDKFARNGEGDPLLKAISATQVDLNQEALSVDDATLLRHKYFMPMGEVLARWPHLRKYISRPMDAGDYEKRTGDSQMVPPTLTSSSTRTTVHQPPYAAPSSPPQQSCGSGVEVKEFWSRPRGPESQTKVTKIVWTADGRPSTRKKMLRFEDGHEEQLYTVVTEGNVVYELPYSDAEEMRNISSMGGLQVLSLMPALEVVTEEIKVPLFPTGRRTIIVGDYVADDGMNPFGHGQFPFIAVHAYRSRHDFYGFSDIDRIATLQEYLNRLYSLLLDAAILTSNPMWLIPTDANVADEDITNAPGAIIRGEGMLLKLARREAGPNMPAYVKDLLAFTIQQIREISGLSESATGGKFKGQQAAETVSMYQEAAGVRFRQGIRNVEQAIVKLGYQFAGIVQQFYTTPRWVKIKDAQGQEIPFSFIGADFSAPFVMKAKAGSQLPTSPSARLNLYMGLLNTPLIDMPEMWRQMQEVGMIESASQIESRMMSYMKDTSQLWKAPGLMQLLMGGQKKSKNQGGKNGRNSGRSARATSPVQATRNIA